MLFDWPSIIIIVLSACGLFLHLAVHYHAPNPPPFPSMPLMEALVTQAGGILNFNQLVVTILSQPVPENEPGTVHDSVEERDAYSAPEYATLEELLHAPAEPADCNNEALLRRPFRFVRNAPGQQPTWIRLQRVRIEGSPDNWILFTADQYLAAGNTLSFEYPFRRLFRTIHQQPLGPASLSPARLAALLAANDAAEAAYRRMVAADREEKN